jgi:hypothetical protein
MEISVKVFQIAIFKCCIAPLDRLDLSFLNVKFLKLEDLEGHIRSVAGESALTHYKVSYDEWTTKWSPSLLISLCANTLETPLQKEIFDDIQRALLILFPSEFRNYSLITFRVHEHDTVFGGEEQVTSSPHRGREMKNPLSFDLKLIPAIETFIKAYFKRPSPQYLRLCIDSYVSHFYQWKESLAYVSLAICMEAIAEGKEMVNYKIRRNLSIINGRCQDESTVIFVNTKNIYELRSRIVHGDGHNASDLEIYLPYLRQLIACTIIELIVHGIDDRKKLDEKITSLGFGQKKLISESYDTYLSDCFCSFQHKLLPKLSKK